MPTYISMLHYTQQGISAIKNSPARIDAAKDAYRKAGGELKSIYLTLGQYDLVSIAEMPNDEAVARMALVLGAQGNIRSETMRAFTETEFRKIAGSLWKRGIEDYRLAFYRTPARVHPHRRLLVTPAHTKPDLGGPAGYHDSLHAKVDRDSRWVSPRERRAESASGAIADSVNERDASNPDSRWDRREEMRLPDELPADAEHSRGRRGSGGGLILTTIMSASHIDAESYAAGRLIELALLPECRL
jgi:uncharacterized protein with GYD domain